MSDNEHIDKIISDDYKLGFETLIESDTFPVGLNEDVIKAISQKKDEPEWLLEFRLKAYAKWLTKEEPNWAHLNYPKIDYQNIAYYSAPKKALDSLDEVDPKILETYEKLGIPLEEQKMLAGVAVDA
ncbi:Fe-S cluster assembly protein SufB, partial [Aduncisulcus paluster]